MACGPNAISVLVCVFVVIVNFAAYIAPTDIHACHEQELSPGELLAELNSDIIAPRCDVYVGDVTVDNTTSLDMIMAVREKLGSVKLILGNVIVEGNEGVRNLALISSVLAINGNLRIQHNGAFQNLMLNSLCFVSGYVDIVGNPKFCIDHKHHDLFSHISRWTQSEVRVLHNAKNCNRQSLVCGNLDGNSAWNCSTGSMTTSPVLFRETPGVPCYNTSLQFQSSFENCELSCSARFQDLDKTCLLDPLSPQNLLAAHRGSTKCDAAQEISRTLICLLCYLKANHSFDLVRHQEEKCLVAPSGTEDRLERQAIGDIFKKVAQNVDARFRVYLKQVRSENGYPQLCFSSRLDPLKQGKCNCLASLPVTDTHLAGCSRICTILSRGDENINCTTAELSATKITTCCVRSVSLETLENLTNGLLNTSSVHFIKSVKQTSSSGLIVQLGECKWYCSPFSQECIGLLALLALAFIYLTSVIYLTRRACTFARKTKMCSAADRSNLFLAVECKVVRDNQIQCIIASTS
jgi:hypothetical protein